MKTCLICGGKSGSREHVFPASFGGKRVNNGIYCEVHNNELGRHVKALLDGLKIFNAIIGVIPDKKQDIRPAEITSGNGEKYLLTKNSIEVAPPQSLKNTPELVGTQIKGHFDNEADKAKWIQAQKNDGFEISVVASSAGTKLFTQPLGTKISIGNPEFKRGLIYLGLTFLAHHYPDVARSTSLSRARDLIMNDSLAISDDGVLWQPKRILDQFSNNPFKHGHTVVVGQLNDSDEIAAFICFYGVIQFGIRLGSNQELPCTIRFTTHIDPLATTLPNDIVEIQDSGSTFELSQIEESDEYLTSVIRYPQKNPFSDLMRIASEERLQADCERALPDFIALANRPSNSITDGAIQILNSQDQRILNLLKYGMDKFLASEHNKFPPELSQVFAAFISEDEQALRGIGMSTEVAISLAKVELAKAITEKIEAKELDAEMLSDFLGQGLGVSIAFGAVMLPTLEIIKHYAV